MKITCQIEWMRHYEDNIEMSKRKTITRTTQEQIEKQKLLKRNNKENCMDSSSKNLAKPHMRKPGNAYERETFLEKLNIL